MHGIETITTEMSMKIVRGSRMVLPAYMVYSYLDMPSRASSKKREEDTSALP